MAWCLFLVFLTAPATNIAQAAAFQWALSAQGSFSNMSSSLAADSNGNCYVTGRTWTTNFVLGGIELTNSFLPQGDMFVAKISPGGAVAWARNVAGKGYSDGSGVAVDRDGNVFVGGDYASANLVLGGTTLPSPINTDIFLVKYTPTGEVLWAKRAVGNGSDFAGGIAVDDSGNCLITGHFFSSTIQFGDTNLSFTPTLENRSDLFLAKFSPAGDVLWAKAFGGSGSDAGTGVATDASGNIYLTGYFKNTISFGSNSLSTSSVDFNPFVAKLDSNGDVVWAKSAPGDRSFAVKIAVDRAGNCFVAGSFEGPSVSFGTNVLTRISGSPNSFLVKYDSRGNVLWARGTGNISAEVAVDALGNAYVTGYFGGNITFGSFMLKSSGSSDAFVVKYNADGTVIWAKQIGGSNSDSGWSIAVEKPDSVFVSGAFRSSQVWLGRTQITNPGQESDDFFLTKLALTQPTLKGKLHGGFLQLTVSGDPGETYAIEHTSNFTDWQTFATYTSPNDAVSLDDLIVTNTAMRFYRAFLVK